MDAFVYISALLLLGLAITYIRLNLASFRSQRSREYVGLGPEFDLRRHLAGRLLCEGVIFGPTGRVTSRFQAKMIGTWNGDTGVLAQEFRYDSGAEQSRAWRLALTRDGRFTADADDVIGSGQGSIVGPTVKLTYRIVLPRDAGGHTLDVTDWMYLTPSGTIINRSQFRKFGFMVAELIATIRADETS